MMPAYAVILHALSTEKCDRDRLSLVDDSDPCRPREHQYSLLFKLDAIAKERNLDMPLIRIDAVEGRSKAEIKKLLDAVHRAVLSAFKVPERDRYQVYQEHPESNLIVEDTGLGIRRTKDVVVVSVISRPRSEEMKRAFYTELCNELKDSCGIQPSDVMVSIVTNSDSDWSFGNGSAQFLTGEL